MESRPAIKNLGELLADKANRYGEKIFLYFKEKEVSFRDLDAISGCFASGLRKLGLEKGDKVCLLLLNIPEFIYSFFGIVRIGAVEVPVNALLKPPEVAFIAENSDSKALITVPAFRPYVDYLREHAPNVRHIIMIGEAEDTEIAFESLLSNEGAPEDAGFSGEDEAGIIYTSGTTGYPKGVVLTHHNYLVNAEQLMNAAQIGDNDRFCCILPLFHVNAQLVTMLGPMTAGASMILLEKFSPVTFLEDLSRFKATAFSAVPTVYAILNSLPETDEYDLSSLRFCICGAAPMPVEVFETFERKFNAFILEGYGLSEATCASSVNPLGGKRKIGSIGLPLAGQAMKIASDSGEASVREIGEIIVQGDVVMKEYYKNPEATANAVRNGWLHTGDLGYKDEDGYFFIVGRKKEMIIRGGENIYPKEVEEALYRFPGVAEAAVVGLPDPVWGEEVYAFVVPEANAALQVESLMAFLKENVADYKCPKAIYTRESLPKTATGKIRKVKIAEEFARKGTE